MKKLLLVSLFAFAAVLSNAQVCTPDPNCATGICPDTIVNLPPAYVNVYYDTAMTIVVPNDTTFNVPGAGTATFKFDSVKFENWNNPTDINLPPTIAVFCDNPNNVNEPCMFYGNTNDCMSLKGTVTSMADTGQWDLVVKTRAYLTCLSPSFVCGFIPKLDTAIIFEGYHLNVLSGVNIREINTTGFAVLQNVPNPVFDKTTISFVSKVKENYSLKIYNILGELVDTKIIIARAGENNIEYNASLLTPGVYTYSLSNGRNTESKRMIVASEK